MKLKPAAYVISVFGGVNATARALNRSPSAISKWKISKRKRGTGGYIPRKAQSLILQQAKKRGLDITAEDVMIGRGFGDK